MTAYRLTPRARDGFSRIAVHVDEEFGSIVADRVVSELEAAFRLLASNPRIGHRRDDLTADERILFWPVGPSLIAYRPTADLVEILFVERADLDWERLLSERH